MKKLLILFFIVTLLVYFFTSAGTTPFDYFTRLADAFLQGKFYLTEGPSWLSELIPISKNVFYVPYAPMPAVLAIPFRFLFKDLFEQQYLSQILGAGIVSLTMLISWTIKKDKKMLIYIGVLSAFGTITWYLSATGSSWYLGQITSVFFISAAIHESLKKKRPMVIGLLLGGAFLSRLDVILSLPFFLYQLFDKRYWFKKYFLLGLGLSPFFLFNFYYNFIRFGTIFDRAYFLLPKILGEENASWFKYGVLSPRYILNNLNTMFLSLPKSLNSAPWVEPSWNGLAIWFTTPAFIYSLFAPLKERIVRYSWISILLVMLVVISHGGNGFAQFGYRFAVDFYPFLYFLMIKSVARTGLKWHHWLLLTLGVIVNLWGVLWINKFGWVGF